MKKKLYKNKNGAMICGVLNGFAEFFSIDVVLLRFIYIILAVFFHSFPAIILYVLLALIMPDKVSSGYTDYDIM